MTLSEVASSYGLELEENDGLAKLSGNLKTLAVHSNGVVRRLDAQRLFWQRRIGENDVAFIAFAERHGDAFDKRDFCAPIRPFYYLKNETHVRSTIQLFNLSTFQLYSFSLPSG